MARPTRADKEAAILVGRRWSLVRERTNRHRYVFRVVGDSDPLNPYEVSIGYDGGLLVESCTCEGGQYHPIRARCSHAEAARLIAAAIGGPKE